MSVMFDVVEHGWNYDLNESGPDFIQYHRTPGVKADVFVEQYLQSTQVCRCIHNVQSPADVQLPFSFVGRIRPPLSSGIAFDFDNETACLQMRRREK